MTSRHLDDPKDKGGAEETGRLITLARRFDDDAPARMLLNTLRQIIHHQLWPIRNLFEIIQMFDLFR